MFKLAKITVVIMLFKFFLLDYVLSKIDFTSAAQATILLSVVVGAMAIAIMAVTKR